MGSKHEEKIKHDAFDVILTNPPFGSKISIRQKAILQQYKFGKNITLKDNKIVFSSTLRKSQLPDILFLEQCVRFLKPPTKDNRGGRMAIVLPKGILNNQSKIVDRAARHWLFQHTKIFSGD